MSMQHCSFAKGRDPTWSSIIDSYVMMKARRYDFTSFVLTSVPYLDNAAFACCRIFSLYIWAARLLYLALVSFVEQPCWRKYAVFKEEAGRKVFFNLQVIILSGMWV